MITTSHLPVVRHAKAKIARKWTTNIRSKRKYRAASSFRECINPGSATIEEDPRRRELSRLWLARNCYFLNNVVPVVALAMLSNMDFFQATTTKFAVIEYMTK